MGVFYGDGEMRVTPDSMHLMLPSNGSPKLCVTINSRDGSYEAQAEYDIRATTRGQRYVVSFPTDYTDKLMSLRVEDLGVLAYASSRCPGPVEAILPVAWGSNVATDKVTVLVNSQRASTRVFSLQLDRYFSCRMLTDTDSKAYDAACDIAVGPGADVIELKLVRKRDAHRLEDVSIPIAVR